MGIDQYLFEMFEVSDVMVNCTSPRHLFLLHTIGMNIIADGSNARVLTSIFDGSIVSKCLFH